MTESRRRLLSIVGLLAISALTAFVLACGDDDDDSDSADGATATADNGGGIDYSSLSGEIAIDGSSTVYPISQAMAEEFGNESDVRVNVAFSGTGGGFEKFCRGEIEVSDASRPIKDEEVQACVGSGIAEGDILEVQVAIDALTVMVNPENDFVECLTVPQLHDIFTGKTTTWDEVDPSYPADDISTYYPGTDSGTFDYFVETVIEGVEEGATHRGDGTSSEDDNVLAQGIENDRNAIGYFGFAYYQEAGQALKAVAIDNGEGCVEPTFEAAVDGSYAPLSRPLFIYTRNSFLEAFPEDPVLGFLDFYLANAEVLVPEVGYVTLPEDLLAEQRSKIEPYLP
jgi:phosphate transport system substrate-binding protein